MTKFQEAKKAAEAPSASTVSAAALVRKIELESLQKELFQLKSAVVDVFIHPQIEDAKAEENCAETLEPATLQSTSETPASDAKPSGIKLSLIPREQANLASATSPASGESTTQSNDEESSTVGKSPVMLAS